MNAWSLLITLIIAIIIWMFAFPGVHFDKNQHAPGVEQKTIEQVNQVESQANQQVNYAREMQKQEQAQEQNSEK